MRIQFYAGLQAEQPSGSPDGPMPSAADVRVVGPAPVSPRPDVMPPAFPQGYGSGGFFSEA